MKTKLIRWLLAVLFVAATGLPALAAKKPPPPENENVQTATENWYLGVIEAIDAKANLLKIRVNGSGQTIQQRRGKEISNVSISSATSAPGTDEHKIFQCSRDCLFILAGQPKATLNNFRVGDAVKVVYLEQPGLLMAQKLSLERGKSPPKQR